MSKAQKMSRVSYADLAAAGLLPKNYHPPEKVRNLTRQQQERLFSDVLTPVQMQKNRQVYEAQCELHRSLGEDDETSRHLKVYCENVLLLSSLARQYFGHWGGPNRTKIPDAVAAGALLKEDELAITNLAVQWAELQRFVGAATRQAAKQSV